MRLLPSLLLLFFFSLTVITSIASCSSCADDQVCNPMQATDASEPALRGWSKKPFRAPEQLEGAGFRVARPIGGGAGNMDPFVRLKGA